MYPLLSKLPPAPSTISTAFRTILLAAGHVAAGDATSAAAAFTHLPTDLRDKAYELCILQAAPLIGIPRTLHSAAALQGAGITGNASGSLLGLDFCSNHLGSRRDLRERGTHTFEAIYGRNAARVRRRLQTFHPALDDWIIGHAYGGVLAKAAAPEVEVTLRERELCVVAVLCVDVCAGVQLASHLRGAINVGATKEEVEAVVRQTEAVGKGDAAAAARAVWATYDRARYAL